eukprot:10207416-Lingulodinium_polyedra.AAC.1
MCAGLVRRSSRWSASPGPRLRFPPPGPARRQRFGLQRCARQIDVVSYIAALAEAGHHSSS